VHGPLLESAIDRLASEIETKVGVRLLDPMLLKLRRILSASAPEDWGAWVERLVRSPHDAPEWLALIESILNHETCFYRRPPQWIAVAEVLDEILAQRASLRHEAGHSVQTLGTPHEIALSFAGDSPIQLSMWSAGCSSGEEAYTLAMVGLEALERRGHYLRASSDAPSQAASRQAGGLRVVGSDVSRIMVQLAQRGEYRFGTMGADRELPTRFRKHFEPIGDPVSRVENASMYRVSDVLRSSCQFRRHNLLFDPPPLYPVDLILCQNVLVYCSERQRSLILSRLGAALRPGAFLMLGLTDPAPPSGFELSIRAGTLVYKRVDDRIAPNRSLVNAAALP